MKANAILKTSMLMALAAMGASQTQAGSTMVLKNHDATLRASSKATPSMTRVRRQSPTLLRGAMWRASGITKHFQLNQRQRRKYNRQRHANGIRGAFAH